MRPRARLPRPLTTHDRDAETQQQPVALRQHRVDGGEDRNRGADGNAADRARGDEIRRMLEGENDIGGAGRGRQRRDQRADERAAALDRDREETTMVAVSTIFRARPNQNMAMMRAGYTSSRPIMSV